MLYPLIIDGQGRAKVKANWYSAPMPPGARGGLWMRVGIDIKYDIRAPRVMSDAMGEVIRF